MSAVRRRVHYFAGFDPRGARHYHQLYQEECAKQAKLNGARFDVARRRRIDDTTSGWRVRALWPEGEIETDYRFMSWSDIVRARWTRGTFTNIARYAALFTRYAWSGAFGKIATAGKGPVLTALLPLIVAALAVVIAVAAFVWSPPAGLAAVALGIAIVYFAFRALRLVWLINILHFCCDWGGGPIAELEARLDRFADEIAAADPADDVLLVGHSAGAPVAMAVMLRLKRRGVNARLLTLGGVLPIAGFMPEAQHLRRDWAELAGIETLDWLDVASLSDPLSFARIDPLASMSIPRADAGRQRRALAKFVHMFDRATFAKLRRDKLRIHFQYLMAAERPTDYDFFRLTAGPLPK